jgi:geranyl-CoA carboxylase alpha subunit
VERGFEVRLDADAGEPERVVLRLAAHGADELALVMDGVVRRLRYGCDEDAIWIDDGVRVARYQDRTQAPAVSADAAGSGRMLAPLDGAVTQLSVAPGDRVSDRQLLVVMEAMKMEHRIVADVDGLVSAVHVAVGQQVKTRQLLVEIEPSQEEPG